MGKFVRWLIFFILPLAIIGGLAVLENLYSSKMGVYRYLLYKKTYYSQTVFTPERIQWYVILLAVGILICLFLFFRKSKLGYQGKFLVLLSIYQAAGIALLSFKDLNAYPLFAFGIISIIFIQYVWLITVMVKK